MVTGSSSEEDSECDCGPSQLQLALEMVSVQGIYRGSSKKSEKICVARWDYATHKSSFSELSYLAFSQNSLSNSPRFASLAYSYFVVYI